MYIAAIDLGGTKTVTAVCNEKGEVLARRKFPTVTADMNAHFNECEKALRECFGQVGITPAEVAGLGMTVPGMADDKGNLIYAPFAGWRDVPISDIFSERLGISNVRADNDVNACAVAETYFCGYKNHLWVTVSTGVGGAVVVDGKLCRGAANVAGELGHVKVEYSDGALCPCGQRGCTEAHASGTAIGRYVAQAAAADSNFNAATGGVYDAKTCAELARRGNRTALSIMDKAGDYLGRAIAAAVNIVNPECVIIGGGVALSLDLLLPAIKRRLASDAVVSAQNTPVVMTKLGYDAGLMGALSLILTSDTINYQGD